MNNIFDMIFIVCGFYLIYSAVKMKKSGSLEGSMLVNKNADLKKAKDIPGYIRFIYGKSIALGILIIVNGLLGVYNTYAGGLDVLQYIIMGISLVVIILYGVFSVKAANKYL